jgi:transcriptional regulator with XRE-family HTH domain
VLHAVVAHIQAALICGARLLLVCEPGTEVDVADATAAWAPRTIRHLRLAAGRSERDFIAACRLTYAALHKIEERGGRTSTITLGHIERMAAELGVSPAALFRRDEATDDASPDTRLLGPFSTPAVATLTSTTSPPLPGGPSTVSTLPSPTSTG